MSNWVAKRITADAANKFQVDSGLFLNKFDFNNPVEPEDADIICETTGAYNIVCQPTTKDIFEKCNNAVKGSKQGLRFTDWVNKFSVGCLSITEETLLVALGAADKGENGEIIARDQPQDGDFKERYWIGDLMDPTKLLLVVLENSISTGGLNFTTENDGNGSLALEITPMKDLKNQKRVPMRFYILTKKDGSAGVP